MRIADSVAIITGASSGIGAATARELARRGGTVVLAARRGEQLQRLADEIEGWGGQALSVPTDVTCRSEVDRLVRTTVEAFGRVDVLVNSAGTTSGSSVVTSDDVAMQRIVDLNLLAPARCAQAVLPHMRRQRAGVIVNIGSIIGEVAGPRSGLYAATKFGVRGLSQALRRELQAEGIAVVLVEPGFIRTRLAQHRRLPMAGPDVVGRAVADAVERPRAKLIVPSIYVPLVIAAKLLPWLPDSLTIVRRARASR